jgi:hypothetical protein
MRFTEENWFMAQAGIFVVSVDVGRVASPLQVAAHRAQLETVGRLAERLTDLQIAATWALAEPSPAMVQAIRASHFKHEVALLADSSWIGPHVARGTMVRELNRRVQAVTTAGGTVNTLALMEGTTPAGHELLARYGIRAIRAAALSDQASRHSRWLAWLAKESDAPTAAPRGVRWGMWELQPSWTFSLGLARQSLRAQERALAAGETFHLVIDQSVLAQSGNAGMLMVEHALRLAERYRVQGQAQIETVSQRVMREFKPRSHAPARSILRVAA